jgi:hypothetical protein
MAIFRSPCLAGPTSTAPVVPSKREPWQGQKKFASV